MSEKFGARKIIIWAILKGVRKVWESEKIGKLWHFGGFCKNRTEFYQISLKNLPNLTDFSPQLMACMYVMVDSAYFVKSTPQRAFTGSFQHFADMLQTY